MLMDTDNGTVLPSSQYIMPNANESRCRQTMMPKVKMRHVPTGDPSYGGNANSGGKAKRVKGKAIAPTTTPLPTPQLCPHPPSSQHQQPPAHPIPQYFLYPPGTPVMYPGPSGGPGGYWPYYPSPMYNSTPLP
ncbi:hypothetical protein FB451DRAFT_1173341 [Mycena latifolia]|nr:hypothetical protein FB451DRAFT_1173341 [Mycena latifolia]